MKETHQLITDNKINPYYRGLKSALNSKCKRKFSSKNKQKKGNIRQDFLNKDNTNP